MTSAGGLLVVQRAYFPSLEARLADGRQLATLPVDLVLLGVEVPAGRTRCGSRRRAARGLAGILALLTSPGLVAWRRQGLDHEGVMQSALKRFSLTAPRFVGASPVVRRSSRLHRSPAGRAAPRLARRAARHRRQTLFLRDVLQTHLLDRIALGESLRRFELPLVDPLRAGGQALAGNLNALPFYPDNLLLSRWARGGQATLWALNAHFWLHWFLALGAAFWMAPRLRTPAARGLDDGDGLRLLGLLHEPAESLQHRRRRGARTRARRGGARDGARQVAGDPAARPRRARRCSGRCSCSAASRCSPLLALALARGAALVARPASVLVRRAARSRSGSPPARCSRRRRSSRCAAHPAASPSATTPPSARPQAILGSFRPAHLADFLFPFFFGRPSLAEVLAPQQFDGYPPLLFTLYPGLLALALAVAGAARALRPARFQAGAAGATVVDASGAMADGRRRAALGARGDRGGALFRSRPLQPGRRGALEPALGQALALPGQVLAARRGRREPALPGSASRARWRGGPRAAVSSGSSPSSRPLLRALPGVLASARSRAVAGGTRRRLLLAEPAGGDARRRSWCVSRASRCSRSRLLVVALALLRLGRRSAFAVAAALASLVGCTPRRRLWAMLPAVPMDEVRAVPRPAADPRGDSRRQRRRARRQPRPLPAGHDDPGHLSRRTPPLAHAALGARALSVRRPAARAAGGARDLRPRVSTASSPRRSPSVVKNFPTAAGSISSRRSASTISCSTASSRPRRARRCARSPRERELRPDGAALRARRPGARGRVRDPGRPGAADERRARGDLRPGVRSAPDAVVRAAAGCARWFAERGRARRWRGPEPSARLVANRREEVVVEVEAPAAGRALRAPRLPAALAGRDRRRARPTLIAQVARLGVAVPAGRHRVRFWIDRRPLAAGFGLAALGLVLLGSCCVRCVPPGRRRRAPAGRERE